MPWPVYGALSMTALISLVTLTSKYVHGLPMWWASILPILGFLGLSILELGWGTWQTDRRMDRQTVTGHHFIMPLPTEVGA